MAGLRFWELTFDADGDTDAGARDRFLTEVRDAGLTDLVVFSHGWNNDHRIVTALYERFFGLLAGQLPAARRGSVATLRSWTVSTGLCPGVDDHGHETVGQVQAVSS